MISPEYLRDWVYTPVIAIVTLVASFLWNQRRLDRKELREELRVLRIDHSKTKTSLSEVKEGVARLDERVKGLSRD